MFLNHAQNISFQICLKLEKNTLHFGYSGHLWLCTDCRIAIQMAHIKICYFHKSAPARCDTCMGARQYRGGNSQTLDGL